MLPHIAHTFQVQGTHNLFNNWPDKLIPLFPLTTIILHNWVVAKVIKQVEGQDQQADASVLTSGFRMSAIKASLDQNDKGQLQKGFTHHAHCQTAQDKQHALHFPFKAGADRVYGTQDSSCPSRVSLLEGRPLASGLESLLCGCNLWERQVLGGSLQLFFL